MNVSEVRVGVLDAAGTPIEVVYVKNAPHYAIYGTYQRAMVHFADDAAEAARQQELLATLNPLRNEINALIDGWRTDQSPDKVALTKLFDRRIADALALAFERDPASAQTLLKSTLDDIAEERQSRGRIEHLLYAGATAGGIAVLVILVALIGGVKKANFLDNDLNALLFAAAVGAVGALVSIGIAIRERRLATDLQTRDNIADAILRVAVGSVGALLLIAMVRADLINVEVNVDMWQGEPAAPAAAAPSAPPAALATVAPPTATPAVPAPSPGGAGQTRPAGGEAAPADSATVTANGSVATIPAATRPAPAENVVPRRSDTARTIGKSRTTELLVMLVIAFFAGFSERLVNQLAQRMQFRDVASDLPAGAVLGGGGTARGPKSPGGGSPAGGPQLASAGGAPDPTGGELAAAEEHVDGCVEDAEIDANDMTEDVELPAARGGVERPVTSNS